MKFHKAMRSNGVVSMVEADGEPWEKNGMTFMIEIPKDITDCDVYEMAGNCNRCIMRHEYQCQLEPCRATEQTTGLLAATAGSKSALIRALNRLDYDAVKAALRNGKEPV